MSAESVTSVVVAIDTSEYAGNFEREMCAFITGMVGECGVGEELTEEAQEELGATFEWFEDHIVSEADDHGCCRPASIWPTLGWFNNGMGGHYKDDAGCEEQAARENYEALVEYHQPHLASVNRRLAEEDFETKKNGWTEEACLREKANIEKELEKAKNAKVHKFPAYQSVAIFFDEVPPKEIMDVIVARAKTFAADRPDWRSYQGEKKSLQLFGVRVLEPKLVRPRKVEHIEVAQYQI